MSTATVTGRGTHPWMPQRGVGTCAGHQRGLLMATSRDLNWLSAGTFAWPRTAGVVEPLVVSPIPWQGKTGQPFAAQRSAASIGRTAA